MSARLPPSRNPKISRWYNPAHSRPSAWRSRMLKDQLAKMLSPEGGFSNHTSEATTLPVLLDGIVKAGRAFRLTSVSMDGRIVGYGLSTRPKDIL